MRRRCRLLGLIVLLVVCWPCLADWFPEDGYKMHAPQTPDPRGWDICLIHQTVADDYLCSDSGPVTDIHFWVGWAHDYSKFAAIDWTVQIYSDAAGQVGQLLWQWNRDDGKLSVRLAGEGSQGWYCPSRSETLPDDHEQYYQVNITQIANSFVQVKGNLYWLVISASSLDPQASVAWKSSASQYFQPALWSAEGKQWRPIGPLMHDLAFVINGLPRSAVEVDTLDFDMGSIGVIMPNGANERLDVAGTLRRAVYFEGPTAGDADDDNVDGLDEVDVRALDFQLTGTNPDLGDITLLANPYMVSTGRIQETANVLPGVLDLSPFTPSGSADSTLDVYFEVRVGDMPFYASKPVKISRSIGHLPPGDSPFNVIHDDIPLLDSAGVDSGMRLCVGEHGPDYAVETDVLAAPSDQFGLILDDGARQSIPVGGTITQVVYFEGPAAGDAHDDDGDGLDEVPAAIADVNLVGLSPTLGPIHVRQNPDITSSGQIEERANATLGILDVPPFTGIGSAYGFFDVWLQVEVGGATLHARRAARLAGQMSRKPWLPGELAFAHDDIPLLDDSGAPSGLLLCVGDHTGGPAVETDEFPDAIAQIDITLPGGDVETIKLAGNMEMTTYFEGPKAGDAFDDNGDGLDEVSTEITQLTMTGQGPSLGQVRLRESPTLDSTGQMRELKPVIPGRLDVSPFADIGMVGSFFDAFFELDVNGLALRTAEPIRLGSVITHEPPATAEQYTGEANVELFDSTGQPTDMRLGPIRLTPSPCYRPYDLQGDGVVDLRDLDWIGAAWLWQAKGYDRYNRADMDCNLKVDFADMAAFAARWRDGRP